MQQKLEELRQATNYLNWCLLNAPFDTMAQRVELDKAINTVEFACAGGDESDIQFSLDCLTAAIEDCQNVLERNKK